MRPFDLNCLSGIPDFERVRPCSSQPRHPTPGLSIPALPLIAPSYPANAAITLIVFASYFYSLRHNGIGDVVPWAYAHKRT